MNATTNYQLNQWAKSDQVRMEDFNADNAKIDAAIKTEASHLRILKTITVPSDRMSLDISLSDLDLSEYLWLELLLRNVRCSGWGTLRLRLNDISGDLYQQTYPGGSGSLRDYAAEYFAYERTENQFIPDGRFRLYTGLGGMRGTSERHDMTNINNTMLNSINQHTWGMQPQTLDLADLSTIDLHFESSGDGYVILAGSQFILTGFRL